MFDGFVHGVVVDVVGGGFGAQQEVIADVLFDEAMAIVTTDDGIGQIEVLEHGWQLSAVSLSNFAAENDRDLVRLANGAVGIQQSLAQFIEGRAAMEDEVIAILDLGKEEAMLTTGLFALSLGEEGGESIQPLAAAVQQVARGEGIGQFLQPCGGTATQEGVGRLLKVDALFPQAKG